MVAFGQSSQFVLGMVITAEDRASSVIRGVGSAIEQLGKSAVSMAGWYVGYQAISSITGGVSDLISNMVTLNAQAESFHATLLSLYRTPTLANRADDFITQFAKLTPATLDQVRAAALEQAGAGLDITKTMGSVGNAAAAMHTDIQTGTHALVTALYGDWTVMRDQLHINQRDLTQFGLVMDNTGHVATNTLLPAFQKFVAQNYPGAMARQMQTAEGEFTNLQDAWDAIQRTMGKPLFTVLEKDLQNLMSYLTTHQAEVQQFAQGVGDAIGFAAGAISIGVPRMFQAIGGEWQHLKQTMGDVGSFFDTLGTGINKAFFLAIKGMTDLSNAAYNAMAAAVNSVVGLTNRAMHDLYIISKGQFGLSARDPGIPTIQIDPATQRAKEADYLRQLFPSINPLTGQSYPSGQAGGGPAPYQVVNEFGQTAAQTLADIRRGAGGGAAGNQGPLAVPGRGNFTDPLAERQRLAAALSDAQTRFSLDQLQGASMQRLQTDIAGIVAAMKAVGQSQAAIALERTRDLQSITSAARSADKADAQHGLDVARKQFELDQSNGANHARLLADIAGILRAMGAKPLGLSDLDRALEKAQDLRAIGDKAQRQLPTLPTLTYQRPDEAGYGATIASFGMPQRDHLAEMVTLLRQQVAVLTRRAERDEQVIALQDQQLAQQRLTAQASVATAGNTSRLASAADRPTQRSDPRGAKALVAVTR